MKHIMFYLSTFWIIPWSSSSFYFCPMSPWAFFISFGTSNVSFLQCVTCSLLAGGAGGQVLEEHYHLVWYLMVDITRIELFKCWLRFSYLDKIWKHIHWIKRGCPKALDNCSPEQCREHVLTLMSRPSRSPPTAAANLLPKPASLPTSTRPCWASPWATTTQTASCTTWSALRRGTEPHPVLSSEPSMEKSKTSMKTIIWKQGPGVMRK